MTVDTVDMLQVVDTSPIPEILLCCHYAPLYDSLDVNVTMADYPPLADDQSRIASNCSFANGNVRSGHLTTIFPNFRTPLFLYIYLICHV